ncbi:hypothetical protein GN958_ATG07621 [Phytophthora infestans]|uniref:Tc1-like transposase DDE domain-containing protein n=1 Tax=Phytophthora infestans TaxID=4787 RepID=A0A8S9URF1_PHYIN|nr:hypothetical protein GN958_ATG22257 [Phytophthora infestans]KAF4143260.1 hypothetical protein GN958_ATG07621 [Phytophthora infestans]
MLHSSGSSGGKELEGCRGASWRALLVVLMLDNAHCHKRAKDVFAEEEFAGAEMLNLLPRLNPIDNVYFAYTNHVKRFLVRQ